VLLGWEFQFLVPIPGTPIGSGIPFLISKIPVGFFFDSAVEKSSNWNSDSEIRNSGFFYVGTQYISFRTRKQSQYLFPPKLHKHALLVKRVDVMFAGLKTSRCDVGRQNNHAAIVTSTQNELPPS
jgi:hypothetical protein